MALKQVKKGSHKGEFPLSQTRFSFYAVPNYYVRASGDSVKVRLWLHHYEEAKLICEEMNKPQVDDDEDVLEEEDQPLQFIFKIPTVQAAFPTTTNFLFPSNRYLDTEQMAKQLRESVEYKALSSSPPLAVENRMIKINDDERPLRDEQAFGAHIVCDEKDHHTIFSIISKVFSQEI